MDSPVRSCALPRHALPFLAWIVAVFPVWCSAGSHAETPTPLPVRQVVIHGNGTAGPYPVGFRFIGGTAAPDSSAFNPRGIRVAAWDDSARTITFDRMIASNDSVGIAALTPPTWIPESYHRETRPGTLPVPPFSTDYRAVRERTPRTFPGLSFGGSKTFNVNVGGGRETALNQSLELTVSGRLSDDITLNAVVSDRNIPVTPEGNTRDLEDLDRVLIELKGPHFTADMGDMDLTRTGARWLSWSRRLSGAKIGLSAGGMSVFGSGAVSEGRYMSTTLTPAEGNQGPYRLVAADGNRDISIIPGSERIWINGTRLVRGETDDYTIDYETGEVIFTGRRIIGSDMRIVADYEYTSESWRRTFYSGGADGTFLGGRVRVNAAAARETDDTSRPVLTELDDAAKKALALAGDSQAYASGIRPAAGDTTGTYDLAGDTLVFNPRGKGKYNATFSWRGDGLGSYRYKGGGVYEFVPPDARGIGSGASYDPVMAIPSPVEHTVAGVEAVLDPFRWMHVETEIAGSTYDRNTLSSTGDSDNGGGAYRVAASVSPAFRLGVPLKTMLSGSFRSRDKSFLPLDRDRTAEENRRWGLPLVMEPGREDVAEYSGKTTLESGRFAGTGISIEGGRAEFEGGALSTRTGASGTVSFDHRTEGSVEIHRISRSDIPGLPDEDIDRIIAGLSGGVAGFTPSLSYERETALASGSGTGGAAYDDIRMVLGSPDGRPLKGEAEWFYRSERARRTVWEDSSLVRGGGLTLTIGSGERGMLKTSYSHRERSGEGGSSTADQAQIDGSWVPPDSRFRAEGSYRAGGMREATKRKNYLYLGEGRGGYRWEDENGDGVRDPEEFIPDEHGEYYLYEETLDDYRPVKTVHAYTRIGADIFGIGTGGPVRTEATVEINEKSTAPASDVFLLKFWDFRRYGVTTSGDARLQEDITAPVPGGGSLRLRLFRLDGYTAEFVSGAERRGEEEQSIRLRMPLSEVSDMEITLTRALWSRFMEERSAGDFRVRSYSTDVTVSRHPGASTATISAGAGIDRDTTSGIRARYATLKPGYTYRFSNAGRIETAYTLTTVGLSGAKAGSRLPYTMAKGRKEGVNHDIRASYDHRITRRMNVMATYTGRKFADRGFEHFGQLQMRAVF